MPASVVPCLGRACLPSSIVGFFHGTFQPHLDQMQYAPINDPARYRLEKFGMRNAPEVVRVIGVNDFRVAAKQTALPPRPPPVGHFARDGTHTAPVEDRPRRSVPAPAS